MGLDRKGLAGAAHRRKAVAGLASARKFQEKCFGFPETPISLN